jgi:predicted transposase/invertase (TIGR01784 family)
MKRKLVSFDWALKNILRNKVNFEILEGFLSELLKEEITILEILESESNQDYREQKWNRVDLKVRNQYGEIILIEIQYNREFDYLQRIFLAACRVATEHLYQLRLKVTLL